MIMAANPLLEKLDWIQTRFEEVAQLITQSDVMSDMKRYAKLGKEYKELDVIVKAGKEYRQLIANIEEAKEMAESGDEEMAEMAKEELEELENTLKEKTQEGSKWLTYLLIIVLAGLLIYWVTSLNNDDKQISYTEFESMVKNNEVAEIDVYGYTIRIRTVD